MKNKFFTSNDLKQVFGSKLKFLVFTGASIDSRNVRKGHMFFAIKGKKNDGHNFLSEAKRRGANAIIVNKKSKKINLPQIVVPNTHKALIKFAKYYRSCSEAKIIGITGSVGKTGTKDALAYILSKHKKVFCSRKSYNNDFGLPLEILNMPRKAEIGIFELGMNHRNEIRNLARILDPDIAVLLNINYVHSGNFKSLDQIALAKSEIFTSSKKIQTLVLNKDNRYFSVLKKLAHKNGIHNVLVFSEKGKTDIFLRNKKNINNKVVLEVLFKSTNRISYKINKDQDFLIGNSLAIIGCLSALDLKIDYIKKLKDVPASTGRGNIIKCRYNNKKIKIIDHTYNSSPVSLIATMKSFNSMKEKNIIYIIGDMNELGKKSLEFHKKILKLTLKQSFDYCIFVGTNFYSIKNLTIKSNVKFMNNVDELIEKIDTFINNRCSIFIKGSNSINLSKIVRHLI